MIRKISLPHREINAASVNMRLQRGPSILPEVQVGARSVERKIRVIRGKRSRKKEIAYLAKEELVSRKKGLAFSQEGTCLLVREDLPSRKRGLAFSQEGTCLLARGDSPSRKKGLAFS